MKWYDLTRWILEKVDSFPKSQRFVFGTRLADHAIDVLETLVKASYSRQLTTELRLSRGMLRFRRRGWVRDQERASSLSGAIEPVDCLSSTQLRNLRDFMGFRRQALCGSFQA